MRVIDCCPYWLQGEIRKLMGDQLMRTLTMGTARDDEVRRVTEALEWLNRKVKADV